LQLIARSGGGGGAHGTPEIFALQKAGHVRLN